MSEATAQASGSPSRRKPREKANAWDKVHDFAIIFHLGVSALQIMFVLPHVFTIWAEVWWAILLWLANLIIAIGILACYCGGFLRKKWANIPCIIFAILGFLLMPPFGLAAGVIYLISRAGMAQKYVR